MFSPPQLEQTMAQALAEARRALPKDVPVGALVLHEGRVIAKGYNRREQDHDPAGHAELIAIREAARVLGNWRLSDCTVVVTLEPCPMCASALIQARVRRVVFGAWDPVLGACGSRYNLFADAPKTEVIGGILEGPCGDLLRDFFRAGRSE